MAKRKIMDAVDLSTSEKVYFKGHAGATYFNNGLSVEDVLRLSIEDTDSEVEDISGFATEDFVNSVVSIKADKDKLGYPLVNQGTSNTTTTLSPNKFYLWGTVSSLTLTLGNEISGIANEYLFQFTSGTTATTLSLPTSVK
jgi:hypothetical protein